MWCRRTVGEPRSCSAFATGVHGRCVRTLNSTARRCTADAPGGLGAAASTCRLWSSEGYKVVICRPRGLVDRLGTSLGPRSYSRKHKAPTNWIPSALAKESALDGLQGTGQRAIVMMLVLPLLPVAELFLTDVITTSKVSQRQGILVGASLQTVGPDRVHL